MATEALAAEALDLLQLAALAVDAKGRLLYCNAAAADLLREGSCLFKRHNTLVARDGAVHEALGRLVRAAVEGVPGAAVLGRSRHPARLLAVAAALPKRAAAMVFIADPHAGAAVALVAQAFGLTAAEARLARGLCCGATLEQQAAAARTTMSTVRTQLRHILAKTGTRRQAELVGLLACLPVLRPLARQAAVPGYGAEAAASASGGPARARRTTSA